MPNIWATFARNFVAKNFQKSGNTGRVVRKKTVLETFPKHFIIDSIAVKADDDDADADADDDDDAARAN